METKRLLFMESYYNSELPSMSGYTIDNDGIINSFSDTEFTEAKINTEELEKIKELINLIEENYIEFLNPESILSNEKSDLLYNDYGVIEKSIYDNKKEQWITLYRYGDVMGYNNTPETKELIKLIDYLYEKYIEKR